MATRSPNQAKSAPESTPAAPQNALQPRPFAQPTQAETAPTLEDVHAQLEQAQRSGHHLTNFAASQPPPIIQPKLTIGAPGDKYEQEADRMAQQVVQRIHMPKPATHAIDRPQATSAVQRSPEPMQHDLQLKPLLQREEILEEDELQMKSILQRKTASSPIDASTDLENAIQQSRGSGQPLAESIRQPMEHAFGGVDFSGVKVHTDAQSDQLNRSIQAKAFTTGQDVFFRQNAYQPGNSKGQELIAHELTHVVQQNGDRIRRKESSKQNNQNTENDLSISSTQSDHVQRKFGFEIEIPILFTDKQDQQVPSLAGGGNIDMDDVPVDAGMSGKETKLVDWSGGAYCYLNVDHNQTLNKLYEAELDQYATDKGLDLNERNSLFAIRANLMPNFASIVEVVTTPWDESTLSRPQALARVQRVVGMVDRMFDAIDGDTQVTVGGAYYIGSDSPNSTLFQPRLGYFHATYGVKLAQVPRLFEQTTQQKKSLARYARHNAPQQEHARNVDLTQRSVGVAKTAMKAIKRLWPRIQVKRKILPDTTKIDLSSAAEKDFLGFLTLLCNYFLLMKAQTSGGDLAKKLVGMHYYKSDLYDVANQLPAQVIDPLQDADPTLIDDVIDVICTAVGIDHTNTLNDGLSGYTVGQYLYQILRGHYGVIMKRDPNNPGPDDNPNLIPKRDANNDTFMDPVLANSINPWSSKLGPEQMGPTGHKGLGVVMENRHLEYLNPEYGALLDTAEAKRNREAVQYGPPKAGPDNRTDDEKAMHDSIGAREEGPAKRPIDEWEGMMMGIYDMVKAINSED